MPCVKYQKLPTEGVEQHWHGVSFVLLDWNLDNLDFDDAVDGATTGATLLTDMEERNAGFLKALLARHFIPVFIFSNEDREVIEAALKREGVTKADVGGPIFVRPKSEATSDMLFGVLEEWLKTAPSVYALKAWETVHTRAKHEFFRDSYAKSPTWPNILWKSYTTDGPTPSQSLGEGITRNVASRMFPFEFDVLILGAAAASGSPEALRKVLEGQRYLERERLHDDSIGAGDLFKCGRKYHVNVRADCDVVRDGDDAQLYCIEGKRLPKPAAAKVLAEQYTEKYGTFTPSVARAYAPFIAGHAIIQFDFRNLAVRTWAEMKDHRVGRILPPLITDIQQRYALYLHRQGLPPTPALAFRDIYDFDKSGEE